MVLLNIYLTRQNKKSLTSFNKQQIFKLIF